MPIGAFTQRFGIGVETSWGVAMSSVKELHPDSAETGIEITPVRLQGPRGVALKDVMSAKSGRTAVTGSFEFSAYLTSGDTFEPLGHILRCLFGSDSVSGTGPYTHSFSVTETPPSFSVGIKDLSADSGNIVVGAVPVSVELSWNSSERVTWSVNFAAKDWQLGGIPTFTPFAVKSVIPGSYVTLASGDAGVVPNAVGLLGYKAISGTLTFSRPVEFIYGPNVDIGVPTDKAHDALEITLSLVFPYESESQIALYKDMGKRSLAIHLGVSYIEANANMPGTAGHIRFVFRHVDFAESAPRLSRGDTPVTIELSGRASFPNGASDLEVKLVDGYSQAY